MLAGADNPVSRVRNSRSHLRMSLKSKIISKRACEESGRERKRKERTQFSLIIIENFIPQRWYVPTARANHMLATSAEATERPRLQVTVHSFRTLVRHSAVPQLGTPSITQPPYPPPGCYRSFRQCAPFRRNVWNHISCIPNFSTRR